MAAAAVARNPWRRDKAGAIASASCAKAVTAACMTGLRWATLRRQAAIAACVAVDGAAAVLPPFGIQCR
ncbi:hypothetical protein GCM10011505_12730 [Tistrella bauzanensis]|uniref:Uncharacterized protein n=1 Tax=Tistrella bauzanensis TaxID=657419 RepID=A0ABQ1IC87_9PROT|nr:hypothetical protein GCM10011505_12730 [Tistrella bauzanensis]